jgi:hypothetical protein
MQIRRHPVNEHEPEHCFTVEVDGDMARIRWAGESITPEYVARLNRALDSFWTTIPKDIQNWIVRWDEEIRPGRGRGLNATYLDGEVFAQIILDVYGYGNESVATLDWVHASANEECLCDVCKEAEL